jgi:hypothetical protein
MYYFIRSVFLEVQDNVPGYSRSYQCEILHYQFIYNSSGIAKLKHTLMVLEYLFLKYIFTLHSFYKHKKNFAQDQDITTSQTASGLEIPHSVM